MARNAAKAPTLEQIQSALRAQGFEVSQSAEGARISKYGCAAVLVSSPIIGDQVGTSIGVPTSVAYKVSPGVVFQGDIARLEDRGYQKFFKTSKYELPATAQQLQAIHRFSEEVAQISGGVSLYNESLGTTSDVYMYDRVKGREAEQPAPARPWELSGGH